MNRGWNTDRAAFVQHYATDVLDSSLLRMPTVWRDATDEHVGDIEVEDVWV